MIGIGDLMDCKLKKMKENKCAKRNRVGHEKN